MHALQDYSHEEESEQLLLTTSRSVPVCQYRDGSWLHNFSFGDVEKKVFLVSQWHWPVWIFLSYRVLAATYISTWWLLSLLYFDHKKIPYPWPAYLTNWSYTILMCHLVMAAAIIVQHAVCSSYNCCSRTAPSHPHSIPHGLLSLLDKPLPWYIKLDWLLFEVSAGAAISVSIIYFTALYPQIHPTGDPPSIEDLHLHAVNSFVVILELALSAFPVRYAHVLYSIFYAIAYTLFSIIYWVDDRTRVIYPKVLDWNAPFVTTGIVLGLIFVGIPLVHAALFCLSKLRHKLYERIYLDKP